MIRENKQGNQLLYLVWKLYEQVTDTVWPFNKGQDNRKSPVGNRDCLTERWPLKRGRKDSTSREVIFGTLKTDRFIEGDY